MAVGQGIPAIARNPGDLKLYQKKFSQFEKALTDLLVGNEDFNVRLEVRGVAGKIIHCQMTAQGTEKPGD